MYVISLNVPIVQNSLRNIVFVETVHTDKFYITCFKRKSFKTFNLRIKIDIRKNELRLIAGKCYLKPKRQKQQV